MSGTTGTVVFDYAAWAARYPELVSAAPQATMFFNEACLYVDNTPCSRIIDMGVRATILNMVTAHIAYLNGPESSPVVGRIASAGEGSVNVSSELAGVPGTAAWYTQSKYGLAAWQAMAAFRTMRYVAGPRYGAPPIYSGGGFTPWR
ncbi:MAG TPA: DUF4054 domain-containing protein [Chloroflexota bacterium]|jgi:hypothetical protein|nr:DUF4054 domain-containing protein [Chloroflexota bacterium]